MRLNGKPVPVNVRTFPPDGLREVDGDTAVTVRVVLTPAIDDGRRPYPSLTWGDHVPATKEVDIVQVIDVVVADVTVQGYNPYVTD